MKTTIALRVFVSIMGVAVLLVAGHRMHQLGLIGSIWSWSAAGITAQVVFWLGLLYLVATRIPKRSGKDSQHD